MGYKLGQDAKIYYRVGGTGGDIGDAAWLELTNVTDVTLNLSKDEADVTTRGNNGWKAAVGTLKDGSIEFEMIWDSGNAGFTAVKDAYFNDAVIGIAALDGAIDAPGSEGLMANMNVTDLTRTEPLTEAIKAKVTLKPTYSEDPPEWVTV